MSDIIVNIILAIVFGGGANYVLTKKKPSKSVELACWLVILFNAVLLGISLIQLGHLFVMNGGG